jgi:hypothetical protein
MNETEQLWQAVRTLTYAVMELAKASVELVGDPKVLDRLQPFYEQLGELSKIHAEHCKASGREMAVVPSNGELHNMVTDLAERFEERERDRARPVHIKVIDNRKLEKQSEI